MLANHELEGIAQEMRAAREQARQIEPFTSRISGFDLAAAYAVGGLIHRLRVEQGAKPVGRKIGFTNPEMWDRYGVRAPIWAHVYDSTVEYLGGAPACCRLGGFCEPKIEPEIVFRFRKAPRAGGTAAELLDSVEWVALGFEIVQSHFPGWRFQAPDTVADDSLHARLLVGAPQPVERLGSDVLVALESFSLELSCDGRLVETGRGSNVLGSPLAAVAHLLSVLAAQPQAAPLAAGEVVTTGTVTAAQPVRAGQLWRAEVRGIALPGVAVAFSA
ncbi:MAG TPA: fumarylacetoacetate hydrolase family protein [Burkholderiales bacterium]|nr:fumarylacetoacetate hydrolase family protein [Burkholderiales bacterium]